MKFNKISAAVVSAAAIAAPISAAVAASDAGAATRTYTISGRVFVDSNKNGVWNSGETAAKGHNVYLLNSRGKQIDKAYVNNAGQYAFHKHSRGLYTVTLPVGGYAGTSLAGVTKKINTSKYNRRVLVRLPTRNRTVNYGLIPVKAAVTKPKPVVVPVVKPTTPATSTSTTPTSPATVPATVPATPSTSATTLSAGGQELLKDINFQRNFVGVPAISSVDSCLSANAQAMVNQVAQTGSYDAKTPDTCSGVTASGSWWTIQKSSASDDIAWTLNDTILANITKANYTHVGIGYIESNGERYYAIEMSN